MEDIKLKGLEKLRLTGIFGIVLGLIIGVLAPFYLGLSGRWQIGLVIFGSAIFCIIGLSSIISYKTGSIGYGFAILAFAFLSQYSLVIFESTLNSQFFIIKILILLCLGSALAIFVYVNPESITNEQEFTPDYANEKKSEVFDRFLKIAGAVLTVMEFINLITSMWRK